MSDQVKIKAANELARLNQLMSPPLLLLLDPRSLNICFIHPGSQRHSNTSAGFPAFFPQKKPPFSLFDGGSKDVIGVLVTAEAAPMQHHATSVGVITLLLSLSEFPLLLLFFFNCHFGVVVTLRNRRYEGEDRSGVKGMKGGLKRRGGGRWRDAGRPSPRKRR